MPPGPDCDSVSIDMILVTTNTIPEEPASGKRPYVCFRDMDRRRVDILDQNSNEEAVKTIVPDIWYKDHILETSRDKLISPKLEAFAKNRG